MQVILQLINREDRGTFYYDGSAFARRWQRRQSGQARARARAAAAAAKAKTAATAASKARVAAHRARVRNRGRTRARPKGGVNGTSSQFISQTGYHTASAKQSRRAARQSQARSLSVKKYGRYSQLM